MKRVLLPLIAIWSFTGSPCLAYFPCVNFLKTMSYHSRDDSILQAFADYVQLGHFDGNNRYPSETGDLIPVLIKLDELERNSQANAQEIQRLREFLADREDPSIEAAIPRGGVSPFPPWNPEIRTSRMISPLPLTETSDGIGSLEVGGNQLVAEGHFIKLPPGEINLRRGGGGTIGDGVWMGEIPVTQLQYTLRMETNPSRFTQNGFISINGKLVALHRPVDSIVIQEAEKFIARENAEQKKDWEARLKTWLESDPENTKSNFSEKYWEYRLPTEFEWEYAARAGMTTASSPARTPEELADYAWFGGRYKPEMERRTQRVATKKPNSWGFFDMQGQVLEATSDFSQPGNPHAARVLRGGSWFERDVTMGRERQVASWSDSLREAGFRLVREERP